MKSLIFLSFLVIVFVIACNPPVSNKPVLKGEVDVADAKRLIKNFGDSYYPPKAGFRSANDTFPDSMDTRCVWFSLVQLDSMIARIKREEPINGDGIRFYFATYDSSAVQKYDIRPDYNTYATLLMVSTKRDTVWPRPDSFYIRHLDYFHPVRKRSIIGAVPENRGELCPPPNICADEGALLFQ